MRRIAMFLFGFVCSVIVCNAVACSATQKADERVVASCTGQEAAAIYGIIDGSASKEDKAIALASIGKDIYDCAKQQIAAQAAAGSGSAK